MGVGKRIWLLLLALVLCLSLPSCKAQSQPYRIFVIARPGNADFYRVVRSGALSAGRQSNVEIQYYEMCIRDRDCAELSGPRGGPGAGEYRLSGGGAFS